MTFIFTDIEGSTSRWEHAPDQMQHDFTRQEQILRETFGAFGGYVYKMVGDAFQVAFATAPVALAAAIEAQRRLLHAAWDGEPMRVRMALHTGVTEERGDDYVGPALNRVARLLSSAHGGQILLTHVTYELVRDDLPAGTGLVDHGEHRLKDLVRPERIYQVNAPGLIENFPPLKTLDTHPHNLPIQLTSFVGREKEMAEVKQMFLDEPGETRLVTLTGPGGTGKTRLSLHVAAELLEAFPDGAWLVELAAITDPTLIQTTLSSLLGVREGPGGPSLNALVDFLRPKRLLLVLDNCEHLVDACARLADLLLRGCPHLCILASSRELLGIGGEVPYRVPSLSIPDTHHLPPLDILSQYEAVRLFIERATLVSPRFTVSNANAPALAEICYRLDGIPLAIELVAARVSMMSVEQIATRLDNSFRLLTGGSRTAMPRHQTLRALIDWSYDTLPPAEQALMQRLAVFMGGWTLEAAETICAGEPGGPAAIDSADILDLLTQLVNKSLVQVEHRPAGITRYRLLETIRQYAWQKLVEGGNALAARRKHMDYFLHLVDRDEDELRGAQMAAWVERFEEDIDNIRAALDFAAQDDLEAGLRSGAALLWFYHIRDYGQLGLAYLERLLAAERAQSQPPSSPSRVIARARALNAAGFMSGSYRTGDSGIVYLRESLDLLTQNGQTNTLEIANTYLNLGRYAYLFFDASQARQYFEQARAIYRANNSRFGLAETLNELAFLDANQDQWEQVIAYFEESLALRRAIADYDGIGFTLASLGEFLAMQGNLPRARQMLCDSLDYFQKSRNGVFTFLSLNFQSFVTWMDGDESEAITLFERLADHRQPSAHLQITINQTNRAGDIALAHGEYPQAIQLYESVLALGQNQDSSMVGVTSLLGLGRAYWALRDMTQARRCLNEAKAMAQPMENKGIIGLIDCALARLVLTSGDDRTPSGASPEQEALNLARQALPLFQMPFWRWGSNLALELLALQAATVGQLQRAAQLSGAALSIARFCRAHRSPAERIHMDSQMGGVRAALGSAEFERLQAQGRAMTFAQASALAQEDGDRLNIPHT